MREEAAPLRLRLASRVRAVRTTLKMPRRMLAERSGVSPRYLAQLESGQGNISILLLERVAEALGVSVVDLLSDTKGLSAESLQIAAQFQEAAPPVRERVQSLLSRQSNAQGRICLVGLRGAGKSSLGRRAATALKIPFVELKTEIESRTGMPIAEIMALYGQDGYRGLEAEAIDGIAQRHTRVILAVGGGIVAEPETYAQLLRQFHSIWIKASPVEHMARVRAQGDFRPMEGQPEAMAQLRALLEARTPLYEQASAEVDTTNRPEQSSLNDVLTVIAKHRFL